MKRSCAPLLLLLSLALGAPRALGDELPRTFEVTAPSGLVVRDAPDGARLEALPLGSRVEVLERQGEWARIGEGRFVHAGYLRPAAAALAGSHELVGTDSQRGDYRVTLELRPEDDGVFVRRTARYRNRTEVQVGRGRVVDSVLEAELDGQDGAEDALNGSDADGPVTIELRLGARGALELSERSTRGDGQARRGAAQAAEESEGRSGRGVLVAIKDKLADELRSGISIDQKVRLGDYLHVGVGGEVRLIPPAEYSPAQAEARADDPSRVWLESTIHGGARVNAGTTVPLGEVSLGVGFEAGARIDYTVVDFYRAPGPGLSTGSAIAEAFKGMSVRSFDLPLSASDALAMRPGARRVLEGRGHVAVSGNLQYGFSSGASPVGLEAAVRVGGYYRLSGRVRIEVERERGNTVWVRVSRAQTRERGVNADVVLRAALDEGRIKEELAPAVDYIDESLIDTRKLSPAERDAILSAGAQATNGVVRRLTRFRLRASASN
ncbi:MAG: SH3 domain-containing protein, partial [Planctomycetes bacterium]|nr:SH3 domain-containing protein [Planctomycetota bacterium]